MARPSHEDLEVFAVSDGGGKVWLDAPPEGNAATSRRIKTPTALMVLLQTATKNRKGEGGT
jgi:hypothetical protein